ncbi:MULTISPECIES: AAA family ATPase [unclassified Rhodococcus (in: high G+C Gram-positive bacteria)]|uniref:AAA family ATPase n=1 Tax=unclassified Rhodococcus (in: high G+C Gram-positive bacteria) TaxID=192944 RepID=UPI000A5F61A8|nr:MULTISPECIES: AAA family ATPase [unclassified Rhodococcus (in: high G+C Gram-positive bacteria)]
MSKLPIRRLTVSDFRRIEGTRELPFDAPVVLIHGPNGTGKTSVLSALELALTGRIQSMERQSDRYRAHLPFFGQPYATVRAIVAETLQTGMPGAPLTVSGARLEGTPAFNDAAANFYAERCYLDQTSLGRLLDLYQAREGTEETALEKFVNELLGLEKLDSLRSGLSDAHDLRLLKKLAVGADEADREAKATAVQLKKESALRTEIRTEVASARAAAIAAITELHPDTTDAMTDRELLQFIESALDGDTTAAESAAAATLHQELIALGGRVSALTERPTTQRIQEIRTALATAIAKHEAWVDTEGAKVREWETAAHTAGADLRIEPRYAIEQAMSLTTQELDNASNIHAQAESLSMQIEAGDAELDLIQTRLAAAHEHSSALVESLSALRTIIGTSDRCPVCDRDFTETGNHSLRAHIDTKLSELTTHGQQLVDLRNVRDQLAARIARQEVEYLQLTARLLPDDQQQTLIQRHATLVDLAAQVAGVEAAKINEADLTQHVRELQQALDNFEAASSEERHLSRELAKYAARLQIDVPPAFDSFQTISTELLEQAEAQAARLTHKATQYRRASNEASRLTASLERESVVVHGLADTAERKKQWDDRVTETKRRQKVAKEVHEAATQARTTIVHRVFTESLNEVWKAVFTRLAPNEGFIPSFGIPNATKKTFDIKLETTHRTGEASGPPQMMLSAGNLNTAALSLFLALHLAVEPIVPCLVFDDPVQAMDEVHIAQFAALIRLLSKQNNRQVIIAVHERELFEYLALELSPAYEGDELITIELGERATEQDQGITRHHWTPDPALAN